MFTVWPPSAARHVLREPDRPRSQYPLQRARVQSAACCSPQHFHPITKWDQHLHHPPSHRSSVLPNQLGWPAAASTQLLQLIADGDQKVLRDFLRQALQQQPRPAAAKLD